MMKSSTAAAALLAARLGAVHVHATSPPLRGVSSAAADEAALLATCSALASADGCGAHESCAWCESGAVPSACYPASMTDRLPAGVFVCGGTATASAAAPTFRLNLQEGVTHTLDSAEVDGDFCDASSLSYAGYMNIEGSKFDTSNNKHLFYWFFEKRAKSLLPAEERPKVGAAFDWPWSKKKEAPAPAEPAADKQAEAPANEEIPLVIWLTGGPGCSSSLALLSENGPCSVNADGKATSVNPHSWTEAAHVLWLDQPADVGYSYGQGNDKNEEMISEDAYYFLQAWFRSPEGAKYKDAPLHIVGESYGGHYAPAIAHRIWRGNNDLRATPNDQLLTLNLKGLAVGNGLTDPEEQYKYYAEMAFKNSHNIKAISESTYNLMTTATPACTAFISKCNGGDGTLNMVACQAAFTGCNMALTSPYRMSGLSPYDISKKCSLTNPLCGDFDAMEKFMNQDSTKQALHVDSHSPAWTMCNMGINMSFHVDWMKNFAPYVADLLNADIPALIYAGDLDFICNYMGNRAWTLKLDWKHKDEFNAAEEHDWNDGAGLARTAGGLTFLQVYDAGHMVPTDQPAHALTMITQHLKGETF